MRLKPNNYNLLNKDLLKTILGYIFGVFFSHLTPKIGGVSPVPPRLRLTFESRATTLRYLQGESTKGFAKSPIVSAKAAKHILPQKGENKTTQMAKSTRVWTHPIASMYGIFTYIYQVFAPSKRRLALGFLNHQQYQLVPVANGTVNWLIWGPGGLGFESGYLQEFQSLLFSGILGIQTNTYPLAD